MKRGYGRAVGANGGGRPVFPPDGKSPMTRYRQPDPPRRSRLRVAGAILGWFMVSLLVLVSGLGGGAYLWAHNGLALTQHHSADVQSAIPVLRGVPKLGRPATALILGYDHRSGQGSDVPSRSDTIMLLRADPRTNTLSMLSFPRDLIVPIYCPGQPEKLPDRINAAYSDCGSKGTLETVQKLTGLDVNYLITVNFHGFEHVVDALGGVWMDVDRRYFNDNAGLGPGYTFATINLEPGYQKLNGSDALDFVRYRHTDSDLYRVARQQAFVKAAKLQLARYSLTSLFQVSHVINAIVSSIDVAQAGGKNIDLKTVKSYAEFLHGLPPGHFYQPRIQVQDVGPELAATPDEIDSAVQDFLHPDVHASSEATSSALGHKPKRPKSVPPATVSITTLNGNGVTGSATAAASALQQRGYRIVPPATGRPSNAPNWNYFRTNVYYNKAQGGTKLAATQVANLFSDAAVGRLPASLLTLSNAAPVTVIVGSTFKGTIAPAPVSRVPVRTPPYIASNPGVTLPLLTKYRRRVPFPLELPSVLERSSLPDDGPGERPVLLYKLNKDHKAVWLTYATNSYGTVHEYWQIGETDWSDAPILQGPNTALTIRGRHYELFYAGGKLHMVVLLENGATYWVVNTLLDSLSTETMLAIAKGLHPLRR